MANKIYVGQEGAQELYRRVKALSANYATAEQGAKADAAYQKPVDGIPKSDLDSGVQASLDKADTALQEHQDISGKADKVANATSGNFAGLDANGDLEDSGIAASDVATSLQNSHSHSNKAVLDATTASYTTEEQTKLNGIESGAEVNLIESVSVAGTALEIESKSVNVPEAGGTAGAWVKGVVSGEDKTRWDSWASAVFPIIPKPNIVVIGGRTYPTVKIGNQMWMAENLDYKWDGLAFPKTMGEVYSQGANYYNNDEATYGVNGNKYGLLYNWYAAKYLNDNRATLLPDGWHVATSSDFNTLFNSVESVDELRSVSGWSQGNGTNESGFNAYPSGKAGYNFQFIGIEAYIACSDQANNQWGWYAQLTKTTKSVGLMTKWETMSIRLVKNLA